MKRYVEVGIGLAVANDFALHPGDQDRMDIAPIGHILPGSCIGICTLKGKFAGQGVRNFMELMAMHMSGYHADVLDSVMSQQHSSRSPLPIIDDA